MNYGMAVAIAGFVLAMGGCSDAPSDGPPALRLGRDECACCGMMVAEDRCSAASLVELPEGRSYRIFDDVGCLLDYQRTHRDEPPVASFVRDYDARAWLNVRDARYVMSESIQTPMGSWIVAFGSEANAEAARERHGGTLLSWDELAAARVSWLKAQGRTVSE